MGYQFRTLSRWAGKHDRILIFLVSLLVKISYYFSLGNGEAGDTATYVALARKMAGLETGRELFISDLPFYQGYPAFLSLFHRFSDQTAELIIWIILAQIVISALSVVFLYRALVLLISSRQMACVFSVFYAINYEVLNWDRYLLTDSLNLSLVLITGCLVLELLAQKSAKVKQLNLAVVLLLTGCLIFFRPTNSIFILISLSFLYFRFTGGLLSSRTTRLVYLLSLTLAAGSIFIVLKPEKRTLYVNYFKDNLKSGVVIEDKSNYDVAGGEQWPILSPLERTEFVARVLAKKTAYFWAVSVEGYSRLHRTLNWLFLLPLWLLGFAGALISILKRVPPGSLYLVSLCLSYNLFHAVTYLDFDFRYRIIVIPFMCLLAAIALDRLRPAGAPQEKTLSADAGLSL